MAEKHPAKAKIKVIDGPDQGNGMVMFNPTEYSITATSKTGESGARQHLMKRKLLILACHCYLIPMNGN